MATNMFEAKNCWEMKKCGVQNNCPAYPNKGKICWGVKGTLCGGKKQGQFTDKIAACKQCEYYAYRRN